MYSNEQRKTLPALFYRWFGEKYPFYVGASKKQLPPPKFPPNIQYLTKPSDKMAQLNIEEPQRSILCGTIIADGSLRIKPKYRNARIQNRHSTRQFTWFFWKWLVALERFVTGLSAISFQNPDGYQRRTKADTEEILGKLHLYTKAHPDLTKLHAILCINNKEFIDRSWLNHMSDYFLMCVWLDDGSLYHSYQGCICLDYSTKEEQQVFCDYLKDAWDIEAYVANSREVLSDGRERHRIFIANQSSLLKILRIVAPKVPVEEMIYKVLFVPRNNPELLQRWASEIKELVQPEFRAYVENFYEEKLNGR